MNNEINNPLPKLLRHYRLKMGYTQKEVADSLSISRSGYANYEEGRCSPSIEQIVELSKLLNHDFLFAYSLAEEAMRRSTKCTKCSDTLSEGSSYNFSLSNNNETNYILNAYGMLSNPEKKLIEKYLSKKINQ